jgi:hypothetical protein
MLFCLLTIFDIAIVLLVRREWQQAASMTFNAAL